MADALVLATERAPRRDRRHRHADRRLHARPRHADRRRDGQRPGPDRPGPRRRRGDATSRSWQLPLEHRYRGELDSDVADIKNLGGANAGRDHRRAVPGGVRRRASRGRTSTSPARRRPTVPRTWTRRAAPDSARGCCSLAPTYAPAPWATWWRWASGPRNRPTKAGPQRHRAHRRQVPRPAITSSPCARSSSCSPHPVRCSTSPPTQIASRSGRGRGRTTRRSDIPDLIPAEAEDAVPATTTSSSPSDPDQEPATGTAPLPVHLAGHQLQRLRVVGVTLVAMAASASASSPGSSPRSSASWSRLAPAWSITPSSC